MKKSNILVIPGSNWQIPIVNKIKSMGHKVLVVNPYEDSPTFSYADGHCVSDIFAYDTVIEYCKKEKINGIISEECDIAMPAVAKYGKELGLETLSVEDAHLFTDKFAMRDFCKRNNFPSPEYKICYSVEDAICFFNEIKTKMIIKPLDSNSSRGVYTIESEDDIKQYFEKTLSYSKIKKAVIIERYINGVEFTIDGIKTPGKHYSLAISEKKHFKHNMNIASELYFTHQNSNFDYELLRKTNDAFVNASGLKFGLTHAEYKYENGVFYLIEIAARGGGNLISSDIVPYMSGVDNYKYLINCSLGNITSPDFTVSESLKERVAVLKFFETPKNGGIVEKIEGTEFLENNPLIDTYKLYFNIGDVIEPAKNDAARVGFYIACCESKEELDSLMEKINNTVKIILKEKL